MPYATTATDFGHVHIGHPSFPRKAYTSALTPRSVPSVNSKGCSTNVPLRRTGASEDLLADLRPRGRDPTPRSVHGRLPGPQVNSPAIPAKVPYRHTLGRRARKPILRSKLYKVSEAEEDLAFQEGDEPLYQPSDSEESESDEESIQMVAKPKLSQSRP